MSGSSGLAMGNDNRANVLPVKVASGPGFLGPKYNPADEMLPPASIGVHRGGDLGDVVGAVKGIIYYGDMLGFGQPSSGFTEGMPGLKPLGVNYFVNSGLSCSNGAPMWEYVQTIPTGSALGEKVKNAIRGVGLPQLRGIAPGILEDAESALNPAPVINAMAGSGYPQCRLVKRIVGNIDGKITNVDGNLLVDPVGLMIGGNGSYYQERWIQDRMPIGKRPGETDEENFSRGEPIQLAYDNWDQAPKTHGEDGCVLETGNPSGLPEPSFCNKKQRGAQVIQLDDGTSIVAYRDGFEDYSKYKRKNPYAIQSLSIAVLSLIALIGFWGIKRK